MNVLQIKAFKTDWNVTENSNPKSLIWRQKTTHLLPFHFVLKVDNYFDMPASFFPGRAIARVI